MDPIDVSPYLSRTRSSILDFVYKLPKELEIDGRDLRDFRLKRWVYSVGVVKLGHRGLQVGDRLAATDTRFYLDPRFETVWLR